MLVPRIISARKKWITLVLASVAGTGVLASPGSSALSIPLSFDPTYDLGPEKQPMGNLDSWYVVGHLTDGAHRFGFFAFYIDNLGNSRYSAISIIDETTGIIKKSEVEPSTSQGNKAKYGIDIRTSNITWLGDMKRMSVTGKMDGGTNFKITCNPRGPVLPYMGTGYFPLFNNSNPNHEYAFPAMRTSGTVTFEGKPYQVTGESWFDRQWGPMPERFFQNGHWTWMAISLSNGDKMALWDVVYKGEQAWVNVLEPDGTITIASITPLAQDASDFWRSQETGQNYPTRWRVIIPGQDVKLDVVSYSKDQEIGGEYEGAVKITGSYKNKLVTGLGYVEMYGHQ